MLDAAEEMLAHCQIMSLLSLYYQALDTRDWTTLERQVMAPDAVWEVTQRAPSGSVTDIAEGRNAVLDWFKRMLGSGTTIRAQHFLNNHVITVDGATARTSSYIQSVNTDSLSITACGMAHAEHVRTDEGWRIRRYKIDEHCTEADIQFFMEALELEYDHP